MNTKDYNQQFKYLDHFCEAIPPLLNAVDDPAPNSIQWVTLGMLGRLCNASKAIKLLMKPYIHDLSLNYPIGILIRPILLDALTALRLYATLKELLSTKEDASKVNAVMTDLGMQLLSDGLNHIISDAKLFKDERFISEAERLELVQVLVDEWPAFFENTDNTSAGVTLKYSGKTGAKHHFVSLVKDKDLHLISEQLYLNYTWFSKYDHFGMLYFSALNRTRIEHDEFVLGSIDLFVHHYANLCDMLQRVSLGNPTIQHGYDIAMNYLNLKLSNQ